MNQIVPLGNKVLLKPFLQAAPKSDAGIILLESQEPYFKGVVVAVPSTLETPLTTGQSVLYEKNAGTKVTHNGEEHLLIPDFQIVATLNEAL